MQHHSPELVLQMGTMDWQTLPAAVALVTLHKFFNQVSWDADAWEWVQDSTLQAKLQEVLLGLAC
jgi:hypothetical protein